MSLILQIDTALETASIGIARAGALIATKENFHQNDHAAWLHAAIQALLQDCGIAIHQLTAVGVTAGPGSYTGLRVGMAAAKGFCYALRLPLITVSTLQLLAAGVQADASDRIIALIDARRDEVFAGFYNGDLEPLAPEQALILRSDSFQNFECGDRVILTGNGAVKALAFIDNKHFFIKDSTESPINLASIIYKKFQSNAFADLAYSEPVYIKEFYTSAKGK